MVPQTPEALALVPSGDATAPLLLACGSDARGLVYAVTELIDRLQQTGDAAAAMQQAYPLVQRPANKVRSIARCFESVVEDKAWFHDRAMWREYLTMLVTHRVNRFNMTFGVQYNYPMEVSDVYFYFTYPFLLNVPGYDVRARGLPDDERDRNLETLRFIAQETARRGLDFQLGLWTHGYKFDSPRANYLIEGITPDNHAPLLPGCPGAAAEIHARDPWHHIAHPRRERHSRGRLRFLEDGVRPPSQAPVDRSRSTCTPRASTSARSTSRWPPACQ